MRHWSVASAIIEDAAGVLLVANRRRDGRVDWSPPGGVVDEGETSTGALGREVREETGLEVVSWSGLLYTIEVEFTDLEWLLEVEVHRAASWSGALSLEDPDGIVIDAAWGDPDACHERLEASPRWVAEPVRSWLSSPWSGTQGFGYKVSGAQPGSLVVERQ